MSEQNLKFVILIYFLYSIYKETKEQLEEEHHNRVQNLGTSSEPLFVYNLSMGRNSYLVFVPCIELSIH
jgi:hypothetical protein